MKWVEGGDSDSEMSGEGGHSDSEMSGEGEDSEWNEWGGRGFRVKWVGTDGILWQWNEGGFW